MAKFKCTNLNHINRDATYRGPSGIDYSFQLDVPVDVDDARDIALFRKVQGFEEITPIAVVKQAIAAAVEKVMPPAEKIPTSEELFKMNRNGQVKLMQELEPGIKIIPQTEKGRVDKILALYEQRAKDRKGV